MLEKCQEAEAAEAEPGSGRRKERGRWMSETLGVRVRPGFSASLCAAVT